MVFCSGTVNLTIDFVHSVRIVLILCDCEYEREPPNCNIIFVTLPRP